MAQTRYEDMFNKDLLKPLFVILTTVLIFTVLFTKIDLQKVGVALLSVNLGLFMLAVVVSVFSNIFVATDKWRRILKELGCTLSLKEALLITIGSDPINFILPLKSGELAKAVYLKRRKNLGFEYGMGLAVLDKALNLFGTLFILCLGIILYKVSCLRSSVLSVSALIMLLGSIDSENIVVSCAGMFKKISIKMFNFIKRINVVLGEISLRKRIWLLVYSIFLQSTELITAYILFRAVGLTVSLQSILIYIPIVVLLSNIPITISGLGTREAAILFLFFGHGSPELLFIVGVLISFIEYILIAIIGLPFLPFFINKTYG